MWGDTRDVKVRGRRCEKRLRMRKAPGVCEVIPEMLKSGGGVMKWLNDTLFLQPH